MHTEDGDEADPRSKVRLIVPNSSCGGIIGKGGSTIKYEHSVQETFLIAICILKLLIP